MYNNNMNMKYAVLMIALLFNVTVVSAEIAPIDCMIEPNVMVELSSPVPGVLGDLYVDKSDEIKKGQVIATLESDLEQVIVKTRKQRLKLRKSEHKRIEELYGANAVTLSEKEQSDNDKKLAELELSHAKTDLALRRIISPINGVVVKRYFTPGEYVANKPIVKLAQLHPLRIEVVSPVENYGKITKGMRARIIPEFGEYTDLIAEVVVVDKVVDAASGTFGVRLQLDNKDYVIPGGLKCTVQFMDKLDSKDTKVQRVTTTQSLNIKTTPIVTSMVESAPLVLSTTPSVLPTTASVLPTTASVLPTADKSLLCVSIGPYKQQNEIIALLSDIEVDIKSSDIRPKTDIKKSYLVISGTFEDYKEVKARMQFMKGDGVYDSALLGKRGEYVIALGIYDKKFMAQKRVDELHNKGYQVYIRPREKKGTTYWADIAYSSDSSQRLDATVPQRKRTACDNSAIPILMSAEQD